MLSGLARNGAVVCRFFELSAVPSLPGMEDDGGTLPRAEFHSFAPSFESNKTGYSKIRLEVERFPSRCRSTTFGGHRGPGYPRPVHVHSRTTIIDSLLVYDSNRHNRRACHRKAQKVPLCSYHTGRISRGTSRVWVRSCHYRGALISWPDGTRDIASVHWYSLSIGKTPVPQR